MLFKDPNYQTLCQYHNSKIDKINYDANKDKKELYREYDPDEEDRRIIKNINILKTARHISIITKKK